MNEYEAAVKMVRNGLIFNGVVVVATAACVAGIAIGTGSLHCLWGLLILVTVADIKYWRVPEPGGDE